MRIELEPIGGPDMDEDTIWQLAGFALSNCRLHIAFDDSDADGEAHTVRVVRRGHDGPHPTLVDENGEVV